MSPERTRKLHEAVAGLLARLREDDEGVPEAALPDLERLHDELAELIEEQKPAEAGLADQLRETLERFESEHPRTTMMVGRIADALSEMGL
jgi:hypothetical protein